MYECCVLIVIETWSSSNCSIIGNYITIYVNTLLTVLTYSTTIDEFFDDRSLFW